MRLLVRHAHAGNKRHWSGPDAERPLSVRGWAQAEGLLETLAELRVERLLTSPSLRCRQTLLPLAAALDLELESVDDLGTDGDVDHLVELLAAADSDGAALCTHGEILDELFARLRARGDIHRGDIPAEGRPRYEKGSTWVLEGAAAGRFHARYLPPPAPPTEHRWWWQGSGRAELGRLALEQQRLLGTIAALTTTTQRLAAELAPQLAALTAKHAALSQLDQVREGARVLADSHARLVETQRRVLGGLLPGAQPLSRARMVAGLTDAGAILTTATSKLGRHPERRWAVLAEQPLAVRAEPAQVERLMLALLAAADAALPPAAPTWVIARATSTGALIAVATDPASLPLSGPASTPVGRRLRPLVGRQAGATPVGQAGQLAERLGGELTVAGGGAASARRLLLRFPLAALPDEVWPDQSPFPATDTTGAVSYN
jgi:phosphohistidine phosphatase SixA